MSPCFPARVFLEEISCFEDKMPSSCSPTWLTCTILSFEHCFGKFPSLADCLSTVISAKVYFNFRRFFDRLTVVMILVAVLVILDRVLVVCKELSLFAMLVSLFAMLDFAAHCCFNNRCLVGTGQP